MPDRSVADYYDHNTRRFLGRGQNAGTHNIHQPLWPSGVRTLRDAVNHANALVLGELLALDETPRAVSPGENRLQVLDLGCGVGASVFYLAQALSRPADFVGVTISEVQANLASSLAGDCGLHSCTFLRGDFEALPSLPSMDLAYAIEAFVHARNADRFFGQAAAALRPGGKLVIIDDFLTARAEAGGLKPREDAWLADFRANWMAPSLLSERKVSGLAAAEGLHLQRSEDLTPYMRIGRPRDKMIGIARRLAGRHLRRSLYLRALCGGYAKQQCLKAGLVQYRRLVFGRGP